MKRLRQSATIYGAAALFLTVVACSKRGPVSCQEGADEMDAKPKSRASPATEHHPGREIPMVPIPVQSMRAIDTLEDELLRKDMTDFRITSVHLRVLRSRAMHKDKFGSLSDEARSRLRQILLAFLARKKTPKLVNTSVSGMRPEDRFWSHVFPLFGEVGETEDIPVLAQMGELLKGMQPYMLETIDCAIERIKEKSGGH